ncbi:MAG: lipopolysaccharide heptosyltransferase I [Burkholderiales bacterium]
MKRILLIKTSSLGDVVHNLPVVSDIRRAHPGAQVEWVVERAFADIPRRHSGVAQVIEVELRRWRRAFWRSDVRGAARHVIDALQREPYDAIVDTQGLMKSAWLAWRARGPAYGKDWASAREPLAFFYDRSFAIPWSLHAVERNRLLAARALGYTVSGAPDFGIAASPAVGDGPYAVLLHATSAGNKLWPEAHWIALSAALRARGLRCVLPWGSPEERARSERLAAGMDGAQVPPALSLPAVTQLLGGARGVVGVDTGLTHLAGALGVPTVGIFVATDPAATGLYGCPHGINVGDGRGVPAVAAVIAALDRTGS